MSRFSTANDEGVAVAAAICRSRVPARHLGMVDAHGDEWRAALSRVNALLGTGCLLALTGKRGAGKTQLAVEAVRTVCERAGEGLAFGSSIGTPAVYTQAMDVFLAVRATYNGGDGSEAEIIRGYCQPALLVLDEIQERGETRWEDRILTHIIDKRYGAMRDTILVTNLEGRSLAESVGPSITSRMIESGGIIECNWPSFREAGAL